METDAGGFRCGPCPKGFIGDGRTCTPGLTCADRPCFPGTSFSFFLTTFIRIVFICLFHYLLFFFGSSFGFVFLFFKNWKSEFELNETKKTDWPNLARWIWNRYENGLDGWKKKFLRVKQFNKNLHSGLNLIDWFDHQKNSFNLTI